MAALVAAILAFICFFLALVGVAVSFNLVTMGLMFMALSLVLANWPARYTVNR